MKSYQTVIIAGASSSGIGFAMAKAYLDRGYNVVGNVRTLDRLEAAAAFGKVDILVNNAGIFIAKPLADYTEAEIEALIDTNIKGFLYPSQQAATHMAKNKSGHIVTITASLAMQPTAKAKHNGVRSCNNTMTAIAQHFDVHYSTMSWIMTNHEDSEQG